MPTTWDCPQCRRRVPLNVEECRCGMLRPRPGAPVNRPPGQAAGEFSWKDVPRSVVVSLGVMVVTLLVGIVWAVLSPPPRFPFVPLLGYIDRPPPTPPPATQPKPPPTTLPEPTPEGSEAAAPEATPEPVYEPTPEPSGS